MTCLTSCESLGSWLLSWRVDGRCSACDAAAQVTFGVNARCLGARNAGVSAMPTVSASVRMQRQRGQQRQTSLQSTLWTSLRRRKRQKVPTWL